MGVALDRSFNYNENDNLAEATASWAPGPSASFIGQNPPVMTTTLSTMPGGLNPSPQALRVDVNASALKNLTPQQPQAFAKAAGNVPVAAVRQAQAISQEQKRRTDERTKLERKQCHSGQGDRPAANESCGKLG